MCVCVRVSDARINKVDAVVVVDGLDILVDVGINVSLVCVL